MSSRRAASLQGERVPDGGGLRELGALRAGCLSNATQILWVTGVGRLHQPPMETRNPGEYVVSHSFIQHELAIPFSSFLKISWGHALLWVPGMTRGAHSAMLPAIKEPRVLP